MNARTTLLLSNPFKNSLVRIYQGLKWPKPLIQSLSLPIVLITSPCTMLRGAVHTANLCSHIPENGSYCTAGHWEPFCATVGDCSLQSLIHLLACSCLTLASPYNNPKLFQWTFQLVAEGILYLRCSALTAIINFSKFCFISFFVNRW